MIAQVVNSINLLIKTNFKKPEVVTNKVNLQLTFLK